MLLCAQIINITRRERDYLYRSISLHNDRGNSCKNDGAWVAAPEPCAHNRQILHASFILLSLGMQLELFFYSVDLGFHSTMITAECCNQRCAFQSGWWMKCNMQPWNILEDHRQIVVLGWTLFVEKKRLYFSLEVGYLYNDNYFIYNKNATDNHLMPPGSILKYFAESQDVMLLIVYLAMLLMQRQVLAWSSMNHREKNIATQLQQLLVKWNRMTWLMSPLDIVTHTNFLMMRSEVSWVFWRMSSTLTVSICDQGGWHKWNE